MSTRGLSIAILGIVLLAPGLCAPVACRAGDSEAPKGPTEAEWAARREAMVADIAARGVEDARVLDALRRVPRHRFVPASHRHEAYADRPLPIGQRQTISQPFMVAIMTQTVWLKPTHRVLEIGTGSGYQAAVLAELVDHVYTIEILPDLAERARQTFSELGYENITVVTGDGYAGIPEHAPYDAIVVTAAPTKVPEKLVEQLAVGGRMVLPVGRRFAQELRLIEKTPERVIEKELFGVRFVPMVKGD